MTNLYENMIRSLLKEEDKDKYSHLIIVIDRTYDEFKKIFVKREQNIKDIIFNIICNPSNEIKEIYNYDFDLEKQINENRAYHLTKGYDKMEEAYEFAKLKHSGQTRLDGSPYINHPVKVAELVKENFSNLDIINELLTAAYLHDVVEDTNTSFEEIENKFGMVVASIVLELTNDEELKEKYGKTDYLCHELEYMSDYALNIKLCDRLANVMDLKNAPDDFIKHYKEETLEIIRYLMNNRKLSDKQYELVFTITKELSNLRESKIKKLVI